VASKQKKRQRRTSSLKEHRRHKKKLTPPFLALTDAQSFSDWRKRRVPDMLWLSAMLEDHGADYRPVGRAMDALDPFVPPGGWLWMDGRLSFFELIPESRRPAARRALTAAAPEALIPELGQALSLFPDCPGAWLFEDWAWQQDHDFPTAVSYLRARMQALEYSKSKHSVHVRMLALGRTMAHGKLALSSSLTVTPLLKRYPRVNAEEAERVEQFSRMTFDMHADQLDEQWIGGVGERWAKTFWAECGKLARSRHPAIRGQA
jgi:hypothetical protein